MHTMTCFLAIQNLVESMKEAQPSDCFQAKYKRSTSLIIKTVPASSHHIHGSMKKFNRQEVYAITSFGIFLLVLRQQQPSQEWMQSTAYQNIKNIVNTACLEQFDDNVNDDGLDHARNVKPSPKHARMERQIHLLKEKKTMNRRLLFSPSVHASA